MKEEKKAEIQEVIDGILKGEYKFPDNIKSKISELVSDNEFFEFLSKLFEAQDKKLALEMTGLLRSEKTDAEVAGKLRYLQGRTDGLDSMKFYLVSWRAGVENERKKEEKSEKK